MDFLSWSLSIFIVDILCLGSYVVVENMSNKMTIYPINLNFRLSVNQNIVQVFSTTSKLFPPLIQNGILTTHLTIINPMHLSLKVKPPKLLASIICKWIHPNIYIYI